MARCRDAIVIGCGAMGAAASLALARRGAEVLAIEQFTRGHDRGSSHGGSRVHRESYFEADAYVPLLQRAGELWEELEELSGERLLHRCGVLYIGDPQGEVMRGVARAASKHGLQVEALCASEVLERFPMFMPPAGTAALWEPRAGFLRPERAVRAMLRLAGGHGATVLEGERVERIDRRDGVIMVETDADEYAARSLVVTAGPWCGALLPDLAPLLKPTRQTIAWIDPGERAAIADESRCPVWFVEDGGHGGFYGVPTAADQEPPRGLKVAHHLPGAATTPDAPRSPVTEAERIILETAMRRLLPGLAGPAIATATCLYTMSPDAHFIVDRVAGLPRSFVACGFSGHGFKFAPTIGEVLAQLVLDGRSEHSIDFLSLGRFRR